MSINWTEWLGKRFKDKWSDKVLTTCFILIQWQESFLNLMNRWPRWSSGLCARLPFEGWGFESHRWLCLVTCCDAGITPLGRLSPYSLGDLAKDREGYCQNDKGCSPTRVRALEKRPWAMLSLSLMVAHGTEMVCQG